MELAIIEDMPEMGVGGLKKTAFVTAIEAHGSDDPSIARLWSTDGIFAGYFCSLITDSHEYHLQNDKGVVRIFKTIDAASNFYSELDINGSRLLSVRLGLT